MASTTQLGTSCFYQILFLPTVEIAGCSKMLVCTYQTVWYHFLQTKWIGSSNNTSDLYSERAYLNSWAEFPTILGSLYSSPVHPGVCYSNAYNQAKTMSFHMLRLYLQSGHSNVFPYPFHVIHLTTYSLELVTVMLTNYKLTTTSLKTAIFIAIVTWISNLMFFIHFSKTAEIRRNKRKRQTSQKGWWSACHSY